MQGSEVGHLRVVGEGRRAVIQPEILGLGSGSGGLVPVEVHHIIGAKSENGPDLYFCIITCKSDHLV